MILEGIMSMIHNCILFMDTIEKMECVNIEFLKNPQVL